MRINILAILLFTCILQVSASAYAQQISIKAENTPLKEVLQSISKQSKYRLWTDNKLMEQSKPISITLKNVTLKEALDKCMEEQSITYELRNNTIIIKQRPISIFDKAIKVLKAIKITGTVKDESGKPLPGVTVKANAGSGIITITDQNGAFSIEVPDNNTILQFSYIGYVTQNVQASANMSIVMTEAIDQLKEFNRVSTGYQSLPKERATGSFSQVNNELFNRRVSTNILERLEGVVPGLAFSTNYDSTNPRQGEFSIRGVSTIFANSRPLIVVDNFPFDGDLYNLNPNDVESITVLKDAAAASIWGARSGNGVIVITTKRGRQHSPLNIEVNANYTYTGKPDLSYGRDFIDASSFIDAEKFLFEKGYYDANISNTTNRPVLSPVVELLAQQKALPVTDITGRAAIDQQIDILRGYDLRNDLSKYFYQQSGKQQYSVNLNGGSERTSYYFSTGYDHIPSLLTGNSNQRYSFSSGLNFRPIKNLEILTSINYSGNNSITANPYPFGRSNYYPYARFADDQGNTSSLPKDYRESYLKSLGTTQLLDWTYKPIEELHIADRTSKANYLKFNTGLSYTFIPGLSIDVKYQLEKQNTAGRNHQSQETYYTRNLINLFTQISGTTVSRPIPLGGILFQNREELTGNSFRAQANFNRTISKDHEINFIGGIDTKELIVDQNYWGLYGYDHLIGTSVPVNYNTSYTKYDNLAFPGYISYLDSGEKLTDEYFSYFSNASYTYKGKYILSGSARIDQSNLFGVNTNQKSVPLWSSGLAWIISKEGYYKSETIPYLKLRTTYGYNGNIDKSVSAFTTGRFRGTSSLTNAPYAEILNPPNPELRWERIGVYNIGVDFATKNNILSGSIEYYTKRGKDIIGYGPVDPTTGVTQFKGNVANIKGQGIDTELTLRIGKLLQWESTLLFSKNSDKVTAYNRQTTLASYLQFADGISGTDLITPIAGKPVFSVYSYPWAGLDATNGDPQGYLNGEVSKDYAAIRGSSDINAAKFHGSARPTTFGSFRNTIGFQDFSLSFSLAYKMGYYFRKPTINYTFFAANWTANSDFTQRWQQPGDELKTNIPSFTYPINDLRDDFFKYASVNVEKGDHIRLQDIQANYNLPKAKIGTTFKSIQLYAYASNLGVIWKSTNTPIDPDFVNNQYLNPKSFSFGIRATF